MRQERTAKRPVRRRNGGGGSDPFTPLPGRPDTAKRTLEKTDDLLRRLNRLITAAAPAGTP